MGKLQLLESNGPQQQPTSSNCNTTNNNAQQQQQQQYLTNCCSSTMPAMPKEKATAVSLTENNFSELKYKELATSAAVVAATAASAAAAAMASTATANSPVVNNSSSPLTTGGNTTTTTLRQQNSSSSLHHHHQHQQQRNLCGCGNASATEVTMRTKYMTNGHSSPLAAAIAVGGGHNSNTSPSSSPHRLSTASTVSGFSSNSNSSSCCRIRYNQTTTNGETNNMDYAATTPSALPTYTLSSSNTSSISSAASASINTLNPNSSTPPTQNLAVTPPKKSPKDFIFGKFIGEGSFSNVYLGVDINTKREYAIKVCEKRQILREHKQEYIRREREVMHMMTNVPGFVNLSCTFQDSRSLYFVMTYAKNGDLLPYINKVGSFDVDSTRHYAAELVLACEQMHRRNIVHRDLKPENILLDEDMHTLIADFGSVKILSAEERHQANAFLLAGGIDLSKKSRSQSGGSIGGGLGASDYDDDVLDSQDDEDNDSSNSSNDTAGSGGDEVDSPRARRQQPRYHRKRRGSFVGTAQYVSPEVLQNSPITPSADLWALGCIIYQMMSGLPPFRGANDYVIFKEIIACNLDFPQGFDKDAEDLVKKLLKLNPAERLGAQDLNGRYESIRSHAFFKNIDFDAVRQQTPPPISPFLPDLVKEEEDFKICENLEPGLDEKQMTRLLGMELGCISDDDVSDKKKTVNNKTNKTVTRSSNSCSSNSSNSTQKSAKNSFDLTDLEKHKRLELQKSDKWHAFAEGEVILKKGFINKRKGLFARRRMFLLTTGPRLIYIDPVQMVKKGEIPWSPELRAEAKNFKIFFVHTPNRTYYLDDPEGFGLEWVAAIEKMHTLTYREQINTSTSNMAVTTITGQTPTLNSNRTTIQTSCSPSITKTSSAISAASASTTSRTNTPHKTSSLLAKPITLLKTASN